MKRGQFKIQKVSNIGTSNTIMSALTIGMFDLIDFAEITKEEKDIIKKTNLNIAKHLTKAEKIAIKICSAIENKYKSIEKNGIETQSNDRCVTIPNIECLDDVRDFLKYGKQALQEMVQIFNIFLNTAGSLPKYNILLQEIKKQMGENDPIYITLKNDHDSWLKYFLDLRSAEEHPTTMVPKGKEFYYDFDINWSEEDQKWIVYFPHFYEGTSIYELLKVSVHNIFTFIEEMNILFLQKRMPSIVEIRKVPNDRVKDYADRRYVVALKDDFPVKKTNS